MNIELVHNILETWLNEPRPDYQEGMAILKSYEDKPALCEQLERYKNPKQLYDALMKLFAKVKEKKSNPLPDKKQVREIIKEVHKNPLDVPKDKVLKDLHYQGISTIKEIDSLKGTLYSIGRNPSTEETSPLSDNQIKQRLTIAKMLMGVNDESKRINATKEYYIATGTLPETFTEKKDAVPEAISYQHYENTRKQVSKLKTKITGAKNKLHGAGEELRLKLLTDINVWEAKLQEEEKTVTAYKAQKNVIQST